MTIANNQQVVNVMRTAVEQGTKTGAKVEYRFGEVADLDGEIASVYLDGNTTASGGFRIPLEMELDVGDHVRVAIAYGSNLGKWVEEIMQCDDRLTDGGCNKSVGLLPVGLDSNLSMGHGSGHRIFVSDGTILAGMRLNCETIWSVTTSGGNDKIDRRPSSYGPVVKGDKAYRYANGELVWDLSATFLDVEFMEDGDKAGDAWFSTDDTKLQRRNTETGNLIESINLSSDGLELRRTPSGQYVGVRQGTGTIKVYTRGLDLEQTISIASFFPCGDWNIDEAFNTYRLTTAGNLRKYSKAGTLLWEKDLAALRGYKWPTLQGDGSGETVWVDDFVRVVGYKGATDWTDGSEAMLLTIDRGTGDVKMEQRFGGDSDDGAQAMAVRRRENCIFISGACTGDEFEGLSVNGTRGFLVRVGESMVAGDAGGGEGGENTSHTHATPSLSIDDLTDVDTSTDPPSDGEFLAWDAGSNEWVPSGSAYVQSLDDLSDVDTSGQSDGDVLTFDSGAGLWVPAAPTGGGGSGSVYLYFPDAPPLSGHANDDEFLDSSIDGDWTEYDHGSVNTPTEGENGLTCVPTDGSIDVWVGYYRALPRSAGAGDFTVTTKVSLLNEVPATSDIYEAGIIMLEDGASSTADLISLSLSTTATSVRRLVTVRRWDQYNDNTPTDLFAGDADMTMLHSDMYLRVRRIGSFWHHDFSTDGVGWTTFFNHTPPFTIQHVGVGLWKGSNRAARAYFRFWRQKDVSTFAARVEGQVLLV